ncbi:MAG: carboxypeptidase-like regulatory domain-containing protein [Bacteroidetes bacterium]|nr:carboxypeptidase-like regulatory domain-containing protein [Bacteroidota bacterium]
MKYKLIILFTLFFSVFKAQIFKGKIIDVQTHAGIPFTALIIEGTNTGTTCDIDGNFTLTVSPESKKIIIQVIGYEKQTKPIAEFNANELTVIKLKSAGFNLNEVVVRPKENPANAIINKVIALKPKYDIANLPHYICNTYAKTYFTFSDKEGKEDFYNDIDTSVMNKEATNFLKKKYIFFMEAITEKKYKYKNNSQEKVLASRVSGFKSAPFASFASQLQSFTFYNDNIELLGLKYLNPLTSGTHKRYNFDIEDTILNGIDTTILIKFYPKKNVKFKAMKGVLYINLNQYVLSNVIAEPAIVESDGTGLKVQQLYQRVDSIHWFPKQLNTVILFNNIRGKSKEKNPKVELVILKAGSKQYIKDVNIDTVFKIKNKNVEIFNDKNFDNKNEAYWQKYRADSLSQKEKSTYIYIDSIGKKENFEKKLKWVKVLASGKINLGYFDYDLKYLLNVNNYEGLRLGSGIFTSDKLSQWFSVGGYGAYGFKDKAFKYGGILQVNFNESKLTFLKAELIKDVYESAGQYFYPERTNLLSTENLRDFLVTRMDRVGYGKLSFNTSIFKFIKTSVYGSVQERNSDFGYITSPSLNQVPKSINTFVVNEAGIQFRMWPREKYIESFGQYISSGSNWPLLYVNFAQGLTNTVYGYAGQFSYQKIDLKINHTIRFKVKGYLNYQLQAGKIFGNLPYSFQYNNRGSRIDNYYVSAEKSFETMYLNEFTSTQYAACFVSLNSGKIIKPNKYFNPEIELLHNYGIGSLQNQNQLTNIALFDISKGFTETGIRIKSILKNNFSHYGIGVFYRYGNYALPNQANNIVVKLVLSSSFN